MKTFLEGPIKSPHGKFHTHTKKYCIRSKEMSGEIFFVNWLWAANLENHSVRRVNVSIVTYWK